MNYYMGQLSNMITYSAEWGHSRVQVIQQPLQNSTYLQQLYNAQGPLLMPGNIALHPGINSQQIQVRIEYYYPILLKLTLGK